MSCEGYDYPEDPYILAGSCGLRYNMDYTKQGSENQHNYGSYGGGGGGGGYGWNDDTIGGRSSHKSRGFFSNIADLIVYAAVGLMAYALYKTCISPSRGTVGDRSDSTTNDDYPSTWFGAGRPWICSGPRRRIWL